MKSFSQTTNNITVVQGTPVNTDNAGALLPTNINASGACATNDRPEEEQNDSASSIILITDYETQEDKECRRFCCFLLSMPIFPFNFLCCLF